MRIVIIGPAHPLRGGLATFNERLARAIQENGEEVSIETFSLQYPDFLFPGQTQYTTDPKPVNLKINVQLSSVNPLSWWRLGQRLSKERPDLIIFRYWLPFMGPCFGTVARLIKRNGHTRLVAITDNVIPHEARPGDSVFTRYFLTALHGCVTMSRAVLEDLNRFVPATPKLYHPHPLYDNFGPIISKPQARHKLNLDPNERLLLFFGFIRAYKGLDLMLQALADSRLKDRQVKLIIAGEFYEPAAPYELLIKELQLENRIIRATDFIPNDQVAAYFCAADLVVQPYKHATQSGVSQIAYHFERPMLVSNVGGLAELIPDGEVGYVTEVSPVAIANSLVKFYDQDKEAAFSAKAAELKKQFSWPSLLRTLKTAAGL